MFFYFLFLCIFVFYLPGRFLLQFVRAKYESFITTTALSLVIGICLFILCTYILSFLHFELFYTICIVIFDILVIRFALYEIQSQIKYIKQALPLLLLLSIGVFITTYLTWKSGNLTDTTVRFFGVNGTDGIYHLSLISNLQYIFPPQHPGLAGVALHGYNFFYDFLVAKFAIFFHFEPSELYFRFFSFLIAFLYGLSGWALSNTLKWSEKKQIALLFIIYWTQDLAYIIPNVLHLQYGSGIVETIANIVDPSVLLSFSLVCVGYILFFNSDKKRKWLLILIFAVLPLLKIYTAVLFFLACSIIALQKAIVKKQFTNLIVLFLGGCLAAVLYLPLNFSSGQLIFAPGLFYTHFLQSFSADNHLQIWNKILVYQQHANIIHITYYYVLIMLLLFIPSLGIRLILLLKTKLLLQKSFYSSENLFWIIMIIVGFLLPSFFIQSVAVFVIIQFFWMAYLFLLLPTAYVLGDLYEKSVKLIRPIIIIVILLISVPQTFMLIQGYTHNSLILPNDFISTAKNVKQFVPVSQSYVVLDAYPNGTAELPITTALSQRQAFYEPEWLEFAHTAALVKQRKNVQKQIEDNLASCDITHQSEKFTQAMQETHTNYIFTFSNHACLNNTRIVKLLYKKGKYGIYQVI